MFLHPGVGACIVMHYNSLSILDSFLNPQIQERGAKVPSVLPLCDTSVSVSVVCFKELRFMSTVFP